MILAKKKTEKKPLQNKECKAKKIKETVISLVNKLVLLVLLALCLFLIYKLFTFIYSGRFMVCVNNIIASANHFFGEIESGEWLGFWGGLIGNIIAIIGVAITLHYERERDREQKRLSVQPMLIVRHNDFCSDSIIGVARFHMTYLLDAKYYSGLEDDLDKEILLCSSDLILSNTGQNAATNIDLTLFYKKGAKSCDGDKDEAYTTNIAYLAPGEGITIKLFISSYLQQLSMMLEWEVPKMNTPSYFEVCFPAILNRYNGEKLKEIVRVSEQRFRLRMRYSDVYGDDIWRYSSFPVYLVQLKDGTLDIVADNPIYGYKEPEY